MLDIVAPHDYQCNNCAALIAENERLKAENERLKRENARLHKYLSWEDRLFAMPSDTLSDAQKIIARAVPRVEAQTRKKQTTDTARDDGFLRIFPEDLAQHTGKSKDRIGPALKGLDEAGMIEYKIERKYNEELGKPGTLSLLGDTSNLKELKVTNEPERNRGNGQRHFICKACHSQKVQVKHLPIYEVVCEECGTVHVYDARKIEDRAFMVNEHTAEKWEELYAPPFEEPEPEPEPVLDIEEPPVLAPPRACFKCGEQNWLWSKKLNMWVCANSPHDEDDRRFLERQ